MLPRFAVALPQDALLQSTPPFDFPGVSMRIFPVRADMSRVQSVVDGWLNGILPPEIAYFRAFSPYVMLVALNYGRSAVIPSNLGWSSQREVIFSVPLQWYRRTRGGFDLVDLAVVTPFIFVDNDLSIPAGREVFGWQKNLIWMDPLHDRWLSNPRAPTKHAGLSTRAFREVYAGKQEQPVPFVAIEEAAAGASLQYPADKLNPLLPWVALHNAMGSAFGLAQDIIDLLAGLGLTRRRHAPLRGGRTAPLDPGGSAAGTLQAILRAVDPYDPDLYTNQINLKQFRDAERPTTACYQDINNTVMRVREINRLGFLGETRVLLGDVTGGYRVTLHQWESLPIADMLGLEAQRSTDVDGATVVTLEPVLPMWADMDLLYAGERRVIAWRSKDQPWVAGPGAAPHERPRASRSIPRGDRLSRAPEKIPYNTALGSSSPVIYGPFETPEATVRVLPLLASERELGDLVDRALNEPLGDMDAGEGSAGSGFSFSPWGNHVYLVICSADATYSVDNNIGSWPSRAVQFLVPVRRFRDGEPDGFALYCPFSFSSSSLAAVSASEINGMAAFNAKIHSPSSTWLDEDGPAVGRGRDLAVVRALVPPILEAGERARMCTLLKVSERGTDTLVLQDEKLNPHWAPRIKRDLERRRPSRSASGDPSGPAPLDVARAHAVDVLGDQAPIPFVALKQFRDVASPDRACYQALIEVEQRLLRVERVEEIGAPLEVVLFDYESMPIAKVLGLVDRSSGYHEGLRCRKLEPVRPFWMTVCIREELATNLAEQQRDLAWVRRAPRRGPRGAAPERVVAPERVAAPGAWTLAERLANLRLLDLEKPRRIDRLLTKQRGKQPASQAAAPAGGVTDPSAIEAIGSVEPQWVIESLLSREWESRSNPVWLQREHEIEHAARRARGGPRALTEQAFGEIKELVSQRKKVATTSHRDILKVIDDELLPRFVGLVWLWAEARHLNEVAFAHRKAEARIASGLNGPPGRPPPPPLHEILHFAEGDAGDAPDPAGAPGFEAAPAAEGAPPAPSAEDAREARTLYDQSTFDALESEEPGIVRRAEGVLVHDVAVGGLLQQLVGLCGDTAASVIKEYASRRSEGAVTGAAPDVFMHFAESDDDGGPPPPFEPLPEGLTDDLEKEATATLATARTLVYLAWKSASEAPGEKRPQWDGFLTDAEQEVERARRGLILALAKCWQKPFACVRRDTAGGADIEDSLFPAASCWSDRAGVAWYSPPEE